MSPEQLHARVDAVIAAQAALVEGMDADIPGSSANTEEVVKYLLKQQSRVVKQQFEILRLVTDVVNAVTGAEPSEAGA